MLLKSIQYAQWEGTSLEWRLEGCTLGNINLIVGKNATGKSRALNIIGNLANQLCGDRSPSLSGTYEVLFDKNGHDVEYTLKYKNSKVVRERLDIDGENLLTRGAKGAGRIYYEQLKQKVRFQAPQNQVISVARRDSIQHPFLEDLYNWGKSTRRYYFGADLGKSQLASIVKDKARAERQVLNPKDTRMVVPIFREGRKRFGSMFTESLRRDMAAIGYDLTDIDVGPLVSVVFETNLPGEIVGLYVQEADLKGKTDQSDMSQGMFRALSLIIQMTYSQMTGEASCILVDDIGEGLDYERSTALVKLLIERAKETSIQLIMATNDRFVMNNVPLGYWSVIQRMGSISKIYNYRNSQKIFDEFTLTGLNNFDFFANKLYESQVDD